MNAGRVLTILRKEARDYRRNRLVIAAMTVMPLLFLVLPIVQLLRVPAVAPSVLLDRRIGLSLLYMLFIPTVVPVTVASYSVVGEREQGTLEPLLSTPIRREEFLLGKALAAFIPAVTIAYTVFGLLLLCTALFARPAVISAVFSGSVVAVQLLFTPLLAGWSIWAGIAISARSRDVRVAQQLGMLASVPPLAFVALIGFGVIQQSLTLELAVAAALLLIDVLGWRLVSLVFDRERLVTGTSGRRRRQGG
jgi:ABC-type Na+ efflux pump permease subunit